MTSESRLVKELEPPGAGLPKDELESVQINFHQGFHNNPLSYYSNLFASETTHMLQLTDEVNEPQRITQVLIIPIRGLEDSSRYWSIYMTLEHLHICNVIFSDIIEKLLRNKEETMTTVLPENLKPSKQSNINSLVAFNASAKAFQHITFQATNLYTEGTHPHPWLGPLSAAGWLAMSAMHMTNHRIQIEQIKENLP